MRSPLTRLPPATRNVERWQDRHGSLPEAGWLIYRTGWEHAEDFLNAGHTPGTAPECARWLAEKTSVLGLGVETVGTDTSQAGTFEDQPFPCHWYLHGAGKYSPTQLRNRNYTLNREEPLLFSPPPRVQRLRTADLGLTGLTGSRLYRPGAE